MSIYYVQKKERMDGDGILHTNFNCTIPVAVARKLGFDADVKAERKVDVSYDEVNDQIIIKKVY